MSIVPAETGIIISPAQAQPVRFGPGSLAAERNPYWVYLAQSPPGGATWRTMKGCLDRIAEILAPTRDPAESPEGSGATLAWWSFGFQHSAALRAALQACGYAPASINKHLSAYRMVLKTSWRLKLMSAEAYHSATDVENVKGKRLPAGRDVADWEIEAMLAACLRDPRPAHSARDAAFIALLASTGFRAQEASDLAIENFNSAACSIAIIGKGDKQREGYLHPDAMAYVGRWLALLDARKIDTREGPLLRALDRWDNIYPRAPGPFRLRGSLDRRRLQAGLRPLTIHDLRRKFAGDLLSAGVDIAIVQQLLGHASVVTTGTYDRRPAQGRQKAVNKLHLPRPEAVLAAIAESAGGEPGVAP